MIFFPISGVIDNVILDSLIGLIVTDNMVMKSCLPSETGIYFMCIFGYNRFVRSQNG